MPFATHEDLRSLLGSLGIAIRDAVLMQRTGISAADLATVSGHAGGDTIYEVDKFGETAILAWFEKCWPSEWPVQVVMEGLEHELCFPPGTAVGDTDWKCILDPIDGTRGIMYDKRSAWALGGIAPQKGDGTMLSEIVAAAMTEIPTSKQWRADQFSTTLDGPLVGASFDVRTHAVQPLAASPSTATNFAHSFSSLAKFFPEGRTLTAQIEERIWDELIGLNSSPSPTVFDDQYISTGGQFYELMAGHDRLVGDLRPLVFRVLDMESSSLVCHPYDACAWLVLKKAGAVYEHPLGGFPHAPLDTESGIAWIAYANETLASLARPVVSKVLHQLLS
ncbi:MAG: inositol monophosphatase [Verrucomicrobiota bacterium]